MNNSVNNPDYLDLITKEVEDKLKEFSGIVLKILILGSYATEPRETLEFLKSNLKEMQLNGELKKNEPFLMADVPVSSDKILDKFVACSEVADVIVLVVVPETEVPKTIEDIQKRGEYLEGMLLAVTKYRARTCLFYAGKPGLTGMIDMLLSFPFHLREEFSDRSEIIEKLKTVLPDFQKEKLLRSKGL